MTDTSAFHAMLNSIPDDLAAEASAEHQRDNEDFHLYAAGLRPRFAKIADGYASKGSPDLTADQINAGAHILAIYNNIMSGFGAGVTNNPTATRAEISLAVLLFALTATASNAPNPESIESFGEALTEGAEGFVSARSAVEMLAAAQGLEGEKRDELLARMMGQASRMFLVRAILGTDAGSDGAEGWNNNERQREEMLKHTKGAGLGTYRHEA